MIGSRTRILIGILFVVGMALLLVALRQPFSIADVHNNTISTTSHDVIVRPTAGTTSATVLRVVDGDTVDVMLSGLRTRVRLIGINSPESVDPRRPVECFGKEASAEAEQILSGQDVILLPDPTQDVSDKYGRRLFYVFLSDGTSFNELMVREGYAYEYTYRTPYRYQLEYKQAERDAREHGRGLWTACATK